MPPPQLQQHNSISSSQTATSSGILSFAKLHGTKDTTQLEQPSAHINPTIFLRHAVSLDKLLPSCMQPRFTKSEIFLSYYSL